VNTTDTGIAAGIIDSIETGKPARIFGNVKNSGLISNLLQGSVVEVACMIEQGWVATPAVSERCRPQCAALNRMSVNVQRNWRSGNRRKG